METVATLTRALFPNGPSGNGPSGGHSQGHSQGGSNWPLTMANKFAEKESRDGQVNDVFILRNNAILFVISKGFVCNLSESLLITRLCGRISFLYHQA